MAQQRRLEHVPLSRQIRTASTLKSLWGGALQNLCLNAHVLHEQPDILRSPQLDEVRSLHMVFSDHTLYHHSFDKRKLASGPPLHFWKHAHLPKLVSLRISHQTYHDYFDEFIPFQEIPEVAERWPNLQCLEVPDWEMWCPAQSIFCSYLPHLVHFVVKGTPNIEELQARAQPTCFSGPAVYPHRAPNPPSSWTLVTKTHYVSSAPVPVRLQSVSHALQAMPPGIFSKIWLLLDATSQKHLFCTSKALQQAAIGLVKHLTVAVPPQMDRAALLRRFNFLPQDVVQMVARGSIRLRLVGPLALHPAPFFSRVHTFHEFLGTNLSSGPPQGYRPEVEVLDSDAAACFFQAGAMRPGGSIWTCISDIEMLPQIVSTEGIRIVGGLRVTSLCVSSQVPITFLHSVPALRDLAHLHMRCAPGEEPLLLKRQGRSWGSLPEVVGVRITGLRHSSLQDIREIIVCVASIWPHLRTLEVPDWELNPDTVALVMRWLPRLKTLKAKCAVPLEDTQQVQWP